MTVANFLKSKVLCTLFLCLRYKRIPCYKNVYLKIYSFILYRSAPLANYCKYIAPSYYSHNLFKNTKIKSVDQRAGRYFFITSVGCTYHYNGEAIVYDHDYHFTEIHKNFSVSKKLNVEIIKPINKTYSIYYLALFVGEELPSKSFDEEAVVLDLPIKLQTYLIRNYKR